MMGKRTGQDGESRDFSIDILRRQYEHGKYPSFILRFGYNQLQGMAEGGLFFGNGDAELFDKLMLQRAMRVHTDKVVVVIPFLSIRSYRDALCRHVGDSSLSRARGQNGRRVQGGCARDGGIRHPRIRSSGLLFARFAVGRAGHSPQTL